MLINLRTMPYETTVIDVLATVLCLCSFVPQNSTFEKAFVLSIMVGTSSKYKKEQWTVTSCLITMYPSPL